MSIQTTTEQILLNLDTVRVAHDVHDRAIGLAVWGLRLGEAPGVPFDEPGPERDALLRFMWLFLIRLPAQESTGFVTSLMRLEMLMGGLESLDQVTADLLESSRFCDDRVVDDALPPSWSHSANALRDVLRRSGDALLLLVLRPLSDLTPGQDASRVAALEARVDAGLRHYLDTGDPAYTVAPEPGQDRADYGLHLAWFGQELRPSAEAAHDLALCLAELGQNAEAEAAYGRAAELDSSWATPLWNRGMLRMERLGDIDGARADTEAAAALDPYNADLRYNLAYIDMQVGDDVQALVHLGQALRLAPREPRFLLDRARVHHRLGEPEAALSDVRRAIADDDTPLARVVQARVLRDLGRLEEASESFDQALRDGGSDRTVLVDAAAVDASRGHRLRAIGRYRAALRDARQADPIIAQAESGLETLGYDGPRTWPLQELSDHEAVAQARAADPQGAAALDEVIDAAIALQQQGQPEQAGELLRAWLAEREAPEAWASLAIVHANRGDAATALQAADRAIAVAPGRVYARTLRARVLSGLGRFDEAAQAWAGVAERRPEVPEAWHLCGAALEGAGRFDEALAAYDRAVTLDPGNLDTHYNRAVVLGNLGRPDEALAQYDQLLQIGPEDIEGRLNRSAFRFGTGDIEGAREDLDALVERHPADGTARAKRGAVREAAGDLWGALFDGLVGFELLAPDAPHKAPAADLVHAGLTTLDVSKDGVPRRTELLTAAWTLVDCLPHDAEDSADAFFSDLAPLLGDTPDFWAVRATIGHALGLPEDACDAWRQRALRIDPAHPFAQYLTAEALLRDPPQSEDAHRALHSLQSALASSDPVTDADWRLQAHLRLGRLHLDCDRLDEAAAVLETGLALDEPADERERTAAHIAFLLGYVRSMQGDAAAALAAYTRGIGLDPTNANLWLNRACEHARLCVDDPSHKEPALADLAHAMERDPTAGQSAENDEYFRPLWEDTDFRSLVALRPPAERAS